MTEEEKYQRKAELLRRAIRVADDLDQAKAETGVIRELAGEDKKAEGSR